jgi:hypothetical protein
LIAAVIPVLNEEKTIKRVLQNLFKVPVNIAIPVINGSTDQTAEIISDLQDVRVKPVIFAEALGIDVPRAIGAFQAYKLGATSVLFVDGDMSGQFTANLQELVSTVKSSAADLALTDCYPDPKRDKLSDLAQLLVQIRLQLNKELGLLTSIGAASPSHGPHCISRRLLEKVPFRDLAVPPVMLAGAALQKLQIRIATAIPHLLLESSLRDSPHSRKMAETIIGDCLEAMHKLRCQPGIRQQNGTTFTGYHRERRFDLLEQFLKN